MKGNSSASFALCPLFVGQPCQQSSEWSNIFLEIAGDLAEGFSQNGGLGSLRLVGVGEVFRNPLEWLF